MKLEFGYQRSYRLHVMGGGAHVQMVKIFNVKSVTGSLCHVHEAIDFYTMLNCDHIFERSVHPKLFLIPEKKSETRIKI